MPDTRSHSVEEIRSKPKLEGGKSFVMHTEFQACRATNRPQLRSCQRESDPSNKDQVLLGATGTGKTFTMAKDHRRDPTTGHYPCAKQNSGRSTLRRIQRDFSRTTRLSTSLAIMTTTSQRLMWPASATPISRRNRRSTNRSTACATRPRGRCLERDDVIIVASVSCIYGIGSVETYGAMTQDLHSGQRL